MAMDYVEIRNANREIIGYVDTAISIIWHSVYYGVGDFEIYATATEKHLDMLKEGYYVTRQDDIEIGIIEKITINKTAQNGRVITASGRFAKSLLDRRIIYKLSGHTNKPTILRGNVEGNVRAVVQENAISCPFDSNRNISILELGASAGISAIIVDENGNAASKQVSYENLLQFTDELLQEYQIGSSVLLNDDTKKLQYCCYAGVDRSIDNASGNVPIIFSTDFDNLIESNYSTDKTQEKNVALIGGEGEGLERFYSLLASSQNGLIRREVFIDASSINRKYKDDSEVEHEYTVAEYDNLLKTKGKQSLAPMIAIESFDGTIDTTSSQFVLNTDYMLGDIVTVQDNGINKYANVRITEITEVQDENGYMVNVNYS